MKYYYDLHIHTALSPCGDNDMTPNNIANMAMLKNLDIIAITDHNTCMNAESVMKVGERRQMLVVPGLEVESAEEVHIVTLFPDIESARHMSDIVQKSMPELANREDIFGEQLLLSDRDEETGRLDNLLIVASGLSIEEIFEKTAECGGIAVPAHADRDSHSVISNLGGIPDDIDVKLIELSAGCDSKKFFGNYPGLSDYPVLRDSDAHYLWDMSERVNYISTGVQINSAADLVALLRGPAGRYELGSDPAPEV